MHSIVALDRGASASIYNHRIISGRQGAPHCAPIGSGERIVKATANFEAMAVIAVAFRPTTVSILSKRSAEVKNVLFEDTVQFGGCSRYGTSPVIALSEPGQ